MSFQNYSTKDIAIVVCGIPIDPGDYAEEFVRISFGEQAFTMKAGGAGGVTRVFRDNFTATIELTLMYGSPANARLSAQFAGDVASRIGVGPLAITDMLSGTPPTTLMLATNAWIRQMPDLTLGSEAPEVTWMIDTARLSMVLGTNFIG